MNPIALCRNLGAALLTAGVLAPSPAVAADAQKGI